MDNLQNLTRNPELNPLGRHGPFTWHAGGRGASSPAYAVWWCCRWRGGGLPAWPSGIRHWAWRAAAHAWCALSRPALALMLPGTLAGGVRPPFEPMWTPTLAGTLAGEVPPAWLAARKRVRCLVCGLSVADRLGVHPTCQPLARAAAPSASASGSPAASGGAGVLPSLSEVQAAGTPTLRHVPGPARHAWGQALTRALAAVAHHNDERSWLVLLMLPKAVLCAPNRGGRKHQKAVAAFTVNTCSAGMKASG